MLTRWIRALWVLGLAVGLAACGGGDDAPPSEASATIGGAGGTLTGPDGVQLVVPAGALTQDTLIRIARTGVGAPALPDGYTSLTPTYEFTPHGLSFNLPVTMRMPYTAPSGAAHADLFMATPGEDWQALEATLSNGMAEWSRLSFSYLDGAACAIPIGNTDPYVCIWPRLGVPLSATPATALVRQTFDNRLSQSTLGAATTLRFTLNYSAAADCGNARVRIIRKNNGTGPVLTLLDQAVSLAPLDGSTKRPAGSTTYDVAMAHADNGSAWFGLSFSCARPGRARSTDGFAHNLSVAIPAAAAPTITQQPVNVTVAAPATATFTAAASGSPMPTLQWQASIDGGSTWSDVAGATALSYTTPATSVGDSGTQYRAMFSNSTGSAPSAAATLIVTPPQATPSFTTQPTNQSVTAGATATFSTVVSGTPAPGVQWQVSTDGGATWADLSGATSAAHTTPATAIGDNGRRYRAVATNSSGSAVSNVAVLTVTTAAPTPSASLKVAAAFRHTCAIKADATLSCWGYNGSAQLGSGNRNSYYEPNPVAGLAGVTAVATGFDETCAIHGSGNLSCWGNTVNLLPVAVAGYTDVRSVAVGRGHKCFITSTNNVRCAGSNSSGQLGDASTTPSATPVLVIAAGNGTNLSNVVALAAGQFHTCALIDNGGVFCWGAVTQTNSAVPMPVVSNAVAIAAGEGQPCVVLADGTVQCWAGAGTLPQTVAGLSGVTSMAIGSQHACAVLSDTRVMCWGSGLMGNGNVSETQPTPQFVGGLSGVTALAGGFQHTCALRSNHGMVCWGSNSDGQLGTGDSAPRTTPTAVLGGASYWAP